MSTKAMAKSVMPLNVDLQYIILSIKDEDIKIIKNIIASTLVVWPSKSKTPSCILFTPPHYFYTCLQTNLST